jgi:hypothetical protein
MSRRKWSGNLERRLLSQQKSLFLNVVQQSLLLHDDSDNDSDDNDDNETLNAMTHTLIHNIVDLDELVNGYFEDTSVVWGQKKQIDDFNDATCNSNFRFRKHHLKAFADSLWPRISPHLQGDRERIVVTNRFTAPYETCLLVYLFKMHRSIRLRPECEKFFGMKIAHLSHIVRTFGDALHRVAESYLTNPRLWQPHFPKYAAIIERHSDEFLTKAWGFIDATFRNTCKPSIYPKALYSGYKKRHGLKFQCVTTPDGYVALLHGPYSGRMHDAAIFRETGLEDTLRVMMPDLDETYHLVADLAYPQSAYVCRGFAGADPRTIEAIFNQRLSSIRVAVEWTFEVIGSLWGNLDGDRSKKILEQPVGQQYINCAFLTNVHNCFYGNLISSYYKSTPFTLDEYLGLLDNLPAAE